MLRSNSTFKKTSFKPENKAVPSIEKNLYQYALDEVYIHNSLFAERDATYHDSYSPMDDLKSPKKVSKRKMSEDRRFKISTRLGVLFEASSFLEIEEEVLIAYGVKPNHWSRDKNALGDHVVLITEMINKELELSIRQDFEKNKEVELSIRKIVEKDKELELSPPKKIEKNQDALDRQLIQTILTENFDRTLIQSLLEQGASPTRYVLYKGQLTSALSSAFASWAIGQKFMPDIPIAKICALLKSYAKEESPAQQPYTLSDKEAYKYLFGEEAPTESVPSNKVAAIKKIFVDIFQLLNSAEKCIPLFEIIEQELIKEWNKTHSGPIPKLDEKVYRLQCHDGTLFPIPKDNYSKTCFPKKNSVLQITLYKIMYDAGLVKIPPQKWIQNIPKKISKKYLQQNVFFVEDRTNFTGLIHGKGSHNLQRILIYLAIKEKYINTQVGDFHITIDELLLSLVDKQYSNKTDKSLLWAGLLDTRHSSSISLSDPHRIHSFVMTSDKRSRFRLLSDCMIHSFCNGVLEIVEILNHYYGDKLWSPSKIWDNILSCMSTPYFFDFGLNVRYREDKRGYTSIISRENGKQSYIILEKNYDSREMESVPKTLSLDEVEQSSSSSLSIIKEKPTEQQSATLKEDAKLNSMSYFYHTPNSRHRIDDSQFGAAQSSSSSKPTYAQITAPKSQ